MAIAARITLAHRAGENQGGSISTGDFEFIEVESLAFFALYRTSLSLSGYKDLSARLPRSIRAKKVQDLLHPENWKVNAIQESGKN